MSYETIDVDYFNPKVTWSDRMRDLLWPKLYDKLIGTI